MTHNLKYEYKSNVLLHTINSRNYTTADYKTEYEEFESETVEPVKYAKNLLYIGSSDLIINELNNCASVEQVLNTIKRYESFLKTEHMTQAILVLKDIQKVFYQYNNFSEKALVQFIEDIRYNDTFKKLLDLIRAKLNSFDEELLSYVLLYLFRLGIPAEDELMQQIAYRLRDHLMKQFNVKICSRLLRVIFSECSVRPYYISLNLIPTIIESIDTCESVEEFGYLTVCLNKLNNLVSVEALEKYNHRVQYFLKNKITGADYRTVLNIALFLNYPKWRSQHSLLVSDCLKKLKNTVGLLNVSELLLIYLIFFKNQEPGCMLNDIQRCAAKFLRQFEDEELIDMELYLQLFTAFIYFSPPVHKVQFRKDVNKFLKACPNLKIFKLQRKILSFIKVSDKKTCQRFWDMALNLLDEVGNIENISQFCINYSLFSTDLTNFRHYRFENKVLRMIRDILASNKLISSSCLSPFLTFTIAFGQDESLLQRLITKFEENITHMSAVDCYYVSDSINELRSRQLTSKYAERVEKLLHTITKQILETDDSNFSVNNLLIRAAIIRKDNKDLIIDDLLYKYKELDHISSKMVENLNSIFINTDSIVPEVFNKCTEYIVNHPDIVVGFNAERVLFLCYYLAYYPINDQKFFESVTNIIIRDQERLSGLAFLQSTLSLCFFHKLPGSFIKQIFNVEFMDKLDLELANCYSKDTYPQRVRTNLMFLNRAVCLEYPEFNVPWFHQKFINETLKQRIREPETHFTQQIEDYLSQVVDKFNIQQNVITPYGYHIDFVVCLNAKREVIQPNSNEVCKRLALLLTKPKAYTKFYIHLKGEYQLKNRHLEILGYEIGIIKFSEWTNLLYSGERLEYLRKIIWPEKTALDR